MDSVKLKIFDRDQEKVIPCRSGRYAYETIQTLFNKDKYTYMKSYVKVSRDLKEDGYSVCFWNRKVVCEIIKN